MAAPPLLEPAKNSQVSVSTVWGRGQRAFVWLVAQSTGVGASSRGLLREKWGGCHLRTQALCEGGAQLWLPWTWVSGFSEEGVVYPSRRAFPDWLRGIALGRSSLSLLVCSLVVALKPLCLLLYPW